MAVSYPPMSATEETIGAGPRSNWACISKKCAARGPEGQANVFEASTKAQRCPECGSKRIERLYDAINISKPGFYRVNKMVDREGAQRMEEYHDMRDAAIRQQKRGETTFAVPIGANGSIGAGIAQKAPMLAPLFGGLAVGGSTPGSGGMTAWSNGKSYNFASGAPTPDGSPVSPIQAGKLGAKTMVVERDERQVLREKLPEGRDRILIQGEG